MKLRNQGVRPCKGRNPFQMASRDGGQVQDSGDLLSRTQQPLAMVSTAVARAPAPASMPTAGAVAHGEWGLTRFDDYASATIQRRNREAAEMLDRVGLAELLERRPDGYHAVPPEFDQQTAAKLRIRFREEASHLLLEEQRAGRHLLACHAIHPAWQAPLGCLTASRLTEPKGWLR